MQMKFKTFLLSTAAIAFGSIELHAEENSISALAQSASFSGGGETSSYRFGLGWSEGLGMSATGNIGFLVGDNAALGFALQGGENVREGLITFGFELAGGRTLLFSAGQLRENAAIGDTDGREWISQRAYGVALEGDKLSANMYLTDSESTDSFAGSRSFGAEVSNRYQVHDAVDLTIGLGYQRIDWNDDATSIQGVSGSLGLSVLATSDTRYDAYLDYNLSELRYGISASRQVGAGSLSASFGQVNGLARDVQDDKRIAFSFAMPLGSASNGPAVATRSNWNLDGESRADLLSQVMERPAYIPYRVVRSGGAACLPAPSDLVIDDFYFASGKIYLNLTSATDLSGFPVSISFNGGTTMASPNNWAPNNYEFYGAYAAVAPIEGATYLITVGCNTYSDSSIYAD